MKQIVTCCLLLTLLTINLSSCQSSAEDDYDDDGGQGSGNATAPERERPTVEEETKKQNITTTIDGSRRQFEDGPDDHGTDTTASAPDGDACEQGQLLMAKVAKMVKNKLPTKIDLPPTSRGNSIKLTLDHGTLLLAKKYLKTQPSCRDEGLTRRYDLLVKFDQPAGSYHWRIDNLFGRSYNETALIVADSILAEFIVSETKSSHQLTLEKVDVGKMYALDVKINIPEDIVKMRLAKRALKYVLSRVTTYVTNRAKIELADHIGNTFFEAAKIKFAQ
ncbi:hypothetical protein HDE_11513 [Halotydeus destructor]|nr:hypothetical protein HDE_11513 [Halotydeus destructor]